MDNRQPSKKDRQLFGLIAHDVHIHADDYRDAGRWLDEYTSEEAYWKRQEVELERLSEDVVGGVGMSRQVQDLQERIQEKRTPALLVRFHEARTYLLDENEGQVLISVNRAKRVILVSWLLTDPDAEKAQLQITNCQAWAWEPVDDLTQMSRGAEYALWAASGARYEAWVGLAQAAWDRVKLNREAGLSSNASPRESAIGSKVGLLSQENEDAKKPILGDSLNLGIVTVHWRNAIPWLRHLKGWRKLIAFAGVGVIIIIVIIVAITRSGWAPLMDHHVVQGTTHDGTVLVFDARGAILNDGGAGQYLDEPNGIQVKVVGTGGRVGDEQQIDELEIVLKPRPRIEHAPLVQPLGGTRNIIVNEGEQVGYEWVYQVLIRSPYGGDIMDQKFRLEILR